MIVRLASASILALATVSQPLGAAAQAELDGRIFDVAAGAEVEGPEALAQALAGARSCSSARSMTTPRITRRRRRLSRRWRRRR
jgi:hypothetical protein